MTKTLHKERESGTAKIYGLGMLYYLAQGYNSLINSIGNISALIDIFIIGILDGMMASKEKDNIDHDKFDKEKLGDLFIRLEKRQNLGIIEGIKSDIENTYNRRLELLNKTDKILSKKNGIERLIINKGTTGASVKNILRRKILQDNDERMEQFLGVANRIDAALTAGSISCLKSAMVMGQFIGEALAQPIDFMCQKSEGNKADTKTLSTAIRMLPTLPLTVLAFTSLPFKMVNIALEVITSFTTVAISGFIDGLAPSTKHSKVQSNIPQEADNIKANNKEETGIWNEIKKTYEERLQDLEDMNLLAKNTENLSDAILHTPSLAKAMRDMQFKRALITMGGENFLKIVDKFSAALEAVCSLILKNVYAGCKAFGNAISRCSLGHNRVNNNNNEGQSVGL